MDDAAMEGQQLAPGALRALRVRLAFRWGGVVVLLVVFALLCFGYGSPGSGVACALLAVGAVVAWWRLTARWVASFRWRVTDASIDVERGLVVRRRSSIPRDQVRHVDVAAGPLDRAAGVASVVVHVAGAPTPPLVLPGVTPEDAEAARSGLVAPVVAASATV